MVAVTVDPVRDNPVPQSEGPLLLVGPEAGVGKHGRRVKAVKPDGFLYVDRSRHRVGSDDCAEPVPVQGLNLAKAAVNLYNLTLEPLQSYA
jgi:hypothetical protein